MSLPSCRLLACLLSFCFAFPSWFLCAIVGVAPVWIVRRSLSPNYCWTQIGARRVRRNGFPTRELNIILRCTFRRRASGYSQIHGRVSKFAFVDYKCCSMKNNEWKLIALTNNCCSSHCMIPSIIHMPIMLCPDAVRPMPQVWSASPTIIGAWPLMFVYRLDVGAVRNMVCVPSKITTWLLIDSVLWCGVPSRWVIHPLVAPVTSHVRRNLLIGRCVVPGHFL